MPDLITHPTAQALVLFGHGKLPDAQTVTVATHLETCADCRNAVASLPPDSFLGKVRAAKPGTSSIPPEQAPAGPGTSPSMAGRSAVAVTPLAGLPPELANHPKFRLVRELGRGGMGVIYLAEHRVMEKQVALKVISSAVLDNPQALARFHAEAKAAGKLDHQNVARAYDADQAGNLHFLVMEFVEGTDLAKVLEKRGPLPVANACYYVRQAALGLQHAHEKGMVHRDIKPQNLMLTPQGLVKVLDFGLARPAQRAKGGAAGDATGLVHGHAGVRLARAGDGRGEEADTRADIYSLGCTLYALLAGRPPFAGTLVNVVMAHIEKEAQPLHELRSEVPPELEAVVAKMLAKDPAQRYQQPIEVAQALVPFIKGGGKPRVPNAASVPPGVASAGTGTRIGGDTSRVKGPGQGEARRPAKALRRRRTDRRLTTWWTLPLRLRSRTRGKKGQKEAKPTPAVWWKRPAVLAGIAAAILALLLVVLWGAGVFKVKTKDGTIVLEDLPPDAEVLVDDGTVTVTSADGKTFEVRVDPGKKHRLAVKKDGFKVFGEKVELDAGGRKSVLVRLEPRIPPAPAPKPDEGEPNVIEEKAVRDLSPADGLKREAIPPGELAAAGGGDLNRAPPELVAILGDSRLSHWAAITPTWIGASPLSYSRDGKTLATASLDGTRTLVARPDTGKLLRSFEGHERSVRGPSLALSPDGMTLATGSDDGTVKLWEVGSGRLRMSLEKQPGGISCLAFSPDGKLLAAAIRDGSAQVCIWEAATGRSRRVISVPNNLWSVAFSPDGKTVAAGGGRWWGSDEGKGWVRFFDLDTGDERHILLGHREPVTSVVFSPDGKTLASTSWDTTTRLWDSATGKEIREFKGHGNRVLSASFSPDGKMLATSCDQYKVRLWEIATGKQQALLDHDCVHAVAFSPDGETLASGGNDHTVRLWDVATRRELPIRSAHTHSVNHLAISPDGKTLACGGNDPSVSLWDVATGRRPRVGRP